MSCSRPGASKARIRWHCEKALRPGAQRGLGSPAASARQLPRRQICRKMNWVTRRFCASCSLTRSRSQFQFRSVYVWRTHGVEQPRRERPRRGCSSVWRASVQNRVARRSQSVLKVVRRARRSARHRARPVVPYGLARSAQTAVETSVRKEARSLYRHAASVPGPAYLRKPVREILGAWKSVHLLPPASPLRASGMSAV